MKVVLVGNGAREHAVAAELAKDAELYAIMSKKNPAIAHLSKEYWICNIENPDAVAAVLKGKQFDLGFASPDATLAAGISDVLEAHGMNVASPSKAASRIEWDKSFLRNLAEKYHIAGAPIHKVTGDPDEAASYITDLGEVAVKPLGLTGGKGVKVSGDHFASPEQAVEYAKSLIKKDGSVLIEEKLIGEEFTLQAFCDGSNIALMPPVQDHKRAYPDDKGPNTGGMGSYSTGILLPFLKDSDIEQANKIIRDTAHAVKKEGSLFRGILYGQFIVTKKGIKLIEFNARFGDPEAMNVMSLLEDSLSNIFISMADGRLKKAKFSDDTTVVKYLVPEGYPENPQKDKPVNIDNAALEKTGAKVYYAAVYETGNRIYTTSSRSFGMAGRARTLEEAEQIAEKACSCITGPLWHRSDIGTRKLIQSKIERMKSIRD
ncbi:phosphoribosylamine--glycine ligase [Candidatus Micrarchaeota archaeon]|nr:phosphoribosylamine--glycine ligase [Candidatus Micrarchaeota archaeon]